jgi:hypothetical protein
MGIDHISAGLLLFIAAPLLQCQPDNAAPAAQTNTERPATPIPPEKTLEGSSTGAVIRRKFLACVRCFHLRARLGEELINCISITYRQ